jgi:hypothetical protein
MRAALMTLVLVAAPAFGDVSVPENNSTSGWREQCAERLERARDRIALRRPEFRTASVAAFAKERAEAGDPTTHRTIDVVGFSLGNIVVAFVEQSDPDPDPNLFLVGQRNGLMAMAWMPSLRGFARKMLVQALDDCLALGKVH